jgi:hypothetical protein
MLISQSTTGSHHDWTCNWKSRQETLNLLESTTAACSTKASNLSSRIRRVNTSTHTASAAYTNHVEIGIPHILVFRGFEGRIGDELQN